MRVTVTVGIRRRFSVNNTSLRRFPTRKTELSVIKEIVSESSYKLLNNFILGILKNLKNVKESPFW